MSFGVTDSEASYAPIGEGDAFTAGLAVAARLAVGANVWPLWAGSPVAWLARSPGPPLRAPIATATMAIQRKPVPLQARALCHVWSKTRRQTGTRSGHSAMVSNQRRFIAT